MTTKTITENLRLAVDKATAAEQGDGFREHLGASLIGNRCLRKVWYNFRWHKKRVHTGRMIRLLSRGHRQEKIVADLFRKIGATVELADSETGEQFVAAALGGHFGGSSDGRISGLDAFGLEGIGNFECKTSNAKNFAILMSKGVMTAKLDHYIQAQMYMGFFMLPWTLYCCVNKDTDDLALELIAARPEMFNQYMDRAEEVIKAKAPPPRISSNSSWWECKFCDYHDICHHGVEPEHNCRTCGNSYPYISIINEERPIWICNRWEQAIPTKADQKRGCDQWTPIPQ